jgi:pimeloyl-ACP methyl ester carboxylesterase
LAILEQLKPANVSLVYNLHHGHDHLERFPALLKQMTPHLVAINLNGMVKDGDKTGKKILPLGQGDLDLELLKTIAASGYHGPIGILGHTSDDAEERLKDNLDGLDWLVPQLAGKTPGPKPKPLTYPPTEGKPVGGWLAEGKAEYRSPPLTVECRAKLNSKESFNILIASDAKQSGAHWELFTMAGSGKFTAYLPGMQPDHVRSETDLCDGQSHDVAMQYEAQRVRLYCDGKLVADQATKYLDKAAVAGQLAFGRLVEGGLGCDGVIEQVRLTKGIRDIPAAAKGAPEADEQTIGLWRFDPKSKVDSEDLSRLKNAAKRAAAAGSRPLDFHVAFDRAVSAEPFTGRVYVMLSRKESKEPPVGPNWFGPEPFFAVDVKAWKPGDVLTISADALACPAPLSKLAPGAYFVQAVMDFDHGARSFGAADGNGYSRALRADLDPNGSGSVALTIDQLYHALAFTETDRVKLIDIESKLLTAFYGQPTHMRAAVVLPASFNKDANTSYPVIYSIPGFGGTHFGAFDAAGRNATNVDGVEFLYVVLDPSCRLGHHVFADSANNGPRGQALVEELIPFIEKQYHGLGAPNGRFVVGHSSGGWSSLWLQVAYPDFFGGVWSLSPDPVDFRDFQRIDLTKPGVNLFTDADGKPRPLARVGGKPVLYFKPFSDMETVMGHGGQLASFEAVFSPRSADGTPRRLWDRATGAVDPEIVRGWEKYDIRLTLERDWKTLGPKLNGKLHVYTGAEDTFYLEGAVRLLQESLKKLGSDAVVEIIPDRDHGSLVDKKMRERIAHEMAEAFRRGQSRLK